MMRWPQIGMVLALLGNAMIATEEANGSDAEIAHIPKSIERVLAWFPDDTETLVGASSFVMPEMDRSLWPGVLNAVAFRDLGWPDAGIYSALHELVFLKQGMYLKPLKERRVALALRGARNFDIVSKFGVLRSESCSIIQFERDLGDAAEAWTGSLRSDAKEIRKMSGHEVFVFPSATTLDRYSKPKSWQGTYLLLLGPDTLLCASSDRYLEEILERFDANLPGETPLNALPEWKYLNFEAPSWMLRHVPKTGGVRHIVGATAMFMKDGFRVTYIPRSDAIDRLEKEIQEQWAPDIPEFPDLKDRLSALKIERQNGGTVFVSSTTSLQDASWSSIRLHLLEQEDGALTAPYE